MKKLNENNEYLKHMLDKFDGCNISIIIDGYESLTKRGKYNVNVTISGDINCMRIGLYSENQSYSSTFRRNTARGTKDIEIYIGEALLQIYDHTSAEM